MRVPECQADFVYVIDGSGSICDSDSTYDYRNDPDNDGCSHWDMVRNFMTNMVDKMRYIGPQGTQVAVVTFANQGKTLWTLDRLVTSLVLLRCT